MSFLTKSPGTTASVNLFGSAYVWVNTDNAKVSDNTYTTETLGAAATQVIGYMVKAGTHQSPSVGISPSLITGSDAYVSFGDSSHLWSNTWTYADINDSGFGFELFLYDGIANGHVLRVTNFGFTIPTNSTIDGILVEVEAKQSGSVVSVDHVRITVYHTVVPLTISVSDTVTVTELFKTFETSGPLSPATTASDSTIGTRVWNSTSSITVSDNVNATSQNTLSDGPGDVTDYAVKIVKSDGTIGTTNKSSVDLWPGSDAYASYGGYTDLWGEDWENININDADFGVVLAVNLIQGGYVSNYLKATNFGFALPVNAKVQGILVEIERRRSSYFAVVTTAYVDHIRMTVYYTEVFKMADTVTVTESVTMRVNTHLSVSDTVTVTENAALYKVQRLSPSTAASATAGGTPWTNPDNAKVSDDAYAVSSIGVVPNLYRARLFSNATHDDAIGFADSANSLTASDAYISYGGLSSNWSGYSVTAAQVNSSDFGVRLLFSNGITTTDNLVVYTFGFTIPPLATINGVLVEAEAKSTTGGTTINVDSVRMTVYYTEVPLTISVYDTVTVTESIDMQPKVVSPTNAYSSNDVYATIPNCTSGQLDVSISKDAGASYTALLSQTYTSTEEYRTFGTGSTELWGTTLTGDDIDDTSLRVKISHNNGFQTIYQIYKTFGFAITPTYVLTGLEVQVEAKYIDGDDAIYVDHVKVKAYYGTSVLPVQAGSQAFASNGRKAGEGAGAGTGVLAFFDGSSWIASDTGTVVQS